MNVDNYYDGVVVDIIFNEEIRVHKLNNLIEDIFGITRNESKIFVKEWWGKTEKTYHDYEQQLKIQKYNA